MGIETVAFAALTAFKAVSSISQGNKNAKTISANGASAAAANTAEGNIALKNKAKEIKAKAARQTVSFLSSGLTLDGTPDSVIGETFSTGQEDLAALASNYNINGSNIISKARQQASASVSNGRTGAINAIMDGFGGASTGGLFDTGAGGIGLDNWAGSYGLSSGSTDLFNQGSLFKAGTF